MDRMIGIIGGSGVYEISGLQDAQWQAVATSVRLPGTELAIRRGRIPEIYSLRHIDFLYH